MEEGLIIRHGSQGERVELVCPHQHGLLYVVPAEASWVCRQELLPAHALAGFFQDLLRLHDPRIQELMQRWGLYFRERPRQSPSP